MEKQKNVEKKDSNLKKECPYKRTDNLKIHHRSRARFRSYKFYMKKPYWPTPCHSSCSEKGELSRKPRSSSKKGKLSRKSPSSSENGEKDKLS